MIQSPLHSRTGRNKTLTENDLVQIHHDMMCCYGWIPYEEFKKLPIPTLWNLSAKVQEEKRKKEKFMLGVMKGLGYKENTI